MLNGGLSARVGTVKPFLPESVIYESYRAIQMILLPDVQISILIHGYLMKKLPDRLLRQY